MSGKNIKIIISIIIILRFIFLSFQTVNAQEMAEHEQIIDPKSNVIETNESRMDDNNLSYSSNDKEISDVENRSSSPYYSITTKNSVLPKGMYGSSAAFVNGKIYIFGGNSFYGLLSDVLEYDPAVDEVKTLSVTMPACKDQSQALEINGKIYLFGGRQDEFFGDDNQILEFNPATETFIQIGSLPGKRWYISAAVKASNGKIYIAARILFLDDLVIAEYDPTTRICTTWQ